MRARCGYSAHPSQQPSPASGRGGHEATTSRAAIGFEVKGTSTLRRERPRLEAGEQKILAGGEIEVRVFPRDHLAGIEQAVRVRFALELELHCVGLLHPALFERVAMRVEDRRAHRFVFGDQLL